MTKQNSQLNLQSGYALFTSILLTGTLLIIAYATTNFSLKQLLLTTSGAESHSAFYVADTGVECAMYWDIKNGATSAFDPSAPSAAVTCGGVSNTVTSVGSGGGGSISLVNTATGSDYTGGTHAIIASNAFNAGSGNLIVVAVRYYRNAGQDLSTVTDTASNSYAYVTGLTTTGGDRMEIWYAKNTNPNVSNVVTASFSSVVSYKGINVIQYSGADTSSPLDTSAVSVTPQSGATVVSNTFTTTSSNEVIVAAAQVANLGTTWTPGSGYTLQLQDSPNRVMIIEDKIVSSLQTNATASVTNSDTSSQKSIILATFKAGAGGGSSGSSTFQIPVGTSCANVTVTKSGTNTTIESRGYNSCSGSNRLERAIRITY